MIYLTKKGIDITLKEYQKWWEADKENRIRIPYETWKKLKNANFIKTMILYDRVHINIDDKDIILDFHKSDHSFGEFLNEGYFKKEEKSKMTTNTTTGYVDTSIYSTCTVDALSTVASVEPVYYYAYDSSAIKDLQKDVETLKKEIKGEKKL